MGISIRLNEDEKKALNQLLENTDAPDLLTIKAKMVKAESEENGIKPKVAIFEDRKVAFCPICGTSFPPLYKYEDGTELLNLSAWNYCPDCGKKIDRRGLR